MIQIEIVRIKRAAAVRPGLATEQYRLIMLQIVSEIRREPSRRRCRRAQLRPLTIFLDPGFAKKPVTTKPAEQYDLGPIDIGRHDRAVAHRRRVRSCAWRP